MNADTESLVEFYHLPGLGVKEQATLLHTGTHDSCHEMYSHLRKVNLVTGDSGYRYSILPTADAGRVVLETNVERARDLAVWRNRVYGEPLPV